MDSPAFKKGHRINDGGGIMFNSFLISEIQVISVQDNNMVLKFYFQCQDTGGIVTFISQFVKDPCKNNRWTLKGYPKEEYSDNFMPWTD